MAPDTAQQRNDRQYLRFSRLNRMLHALMIVSFLSLALTGMTLKFSYTAWASILSRLFGGFQTRRIYAPPCGDGDDRRSS